MDDVDLRAALERTTTFLKDPAEALDACRLCVEHDPDGPIGDAARITAAAAGAFVGLMSRQPGEVPSLDAAKYKSKAEIARRLTSIAGPVLANGLVTQARSRDAAKRADIVKFLDAAAEADARFLRPLFNEATVEAEALLVGGRTRAQAEGKTREDVYDDAETHYKTFSEGDLPGALRGFAHLKSLNPSDAYMRNMVGLILSTQGKTREALREFLYGFNLDPGNANLASNLMREFSALGLHSAAIEASRHYQGHRRDETPAASEQMLQLFAKLSALIMETIACAVAGVGKKDFLPSATSVLDEMPAKARPWLSEPSESGDADPALDQARIFISYRRADGAELVERLHRKLKTVYPAVEVFLDEAAMVGGQKFEARIRDEIENASIFLLVIGAQWHGKAGLARLNETGDVLRREVAWALNRNIPIVPVLLGDTRMPSAASLPEELAPIPKRHAERLREASFDADWARLDKSSVRTITERLLSARATAEDFDKILDQAEADPDGASRKFGTLAKQWKETLPKFIAARAERGQGVSDSIELGGTWECSVSGFDGEFSLRFVLEAANRMSGEWRVRRQGSRVRENHDLRGEWIKIWDRDGEKYLGLQLNFVLGTTPTTCTIPFHRKVGDVIVGKDERDREYTSRNVEPRERGF